MRCGITLAHAKLCERASRRDMTLSDAATRARQSILCHRCARHRLYGTSSMRIVLYSQEMLGSPPGRVTELRLRTIPNSANIGHIWPLSRSNLVNLVSTCLKVATLGQLLSELARALAETGSNSFELGSDLDQLGRTLAPLGPHSASFCPQSAPRSKPGQISPKSAQSSVGIRPALAGIGPHFCRNLAKFGER